MNPSPFAYAPAPESVRPALKPSYGLFIGGSFVAPRSGRSFRTINPATEEPIAEVADAGAADVLVVAGGIIPEEDRAGLEAAGIAAIFGPGSTIAEIATYLRAHVRSN